MSIHPTALVDSQVKIHPSVSVGPFAVIKGQVTIGENTVIDSHVSIGSETGIVEIGSGNRFHQNSVIGGTPQDLKYKGEDTKLIVGDNNVIREYVTMNIGTVTGLGETRIGNNNLIMAYVHVAHDCVFGNHIVVANLAQCAGHVEIQDHVIVGGRVSITQFARLGKFSYVGANSAINKDIAPFAMAEGHWAVMRATNKVGLERNGYDKNSVQNIHKALRALIKGEGTLPEIIKRIKEECEPSEALQELLFFIESSKKGLAR